MGVSPETLKRLQARPELVRNICILAHVDHGKTTLSDSLLASNGIISPQMAGKLRYLDSRPDEQLRGITMESSAISLYFKVAARAPSNDDNSKPPQQSNPTPRGLPGRPALNPNIKEYLINLIDSPGHIDFSSEVSTASRLSDGALVLVDAVEGVLSQTVTVLRQAWVEKLKPILVINKVDRLITELRLTPTEAYTHLTRLIERVNAVMGSFFAMDRMEQDLKWRELQELRTLDDNTSENVFVEQSDENLYFSPELNNIIFASAIDGWGFTVGQFAGIYERKLGMKREKLEKVLWGNYFFDPKTKRVISGSSSAAKALKGTPKPLFVQLVLDNLWKVYESSVVERDPEQSAKIVSALGLKISPTIIKAKDGKPLLSAILTQWIPLSVSVLLTVIDKIPAPIDAQKERIPSILDSVPGGAADELDPLVRDSMISCDRNGPVVSYISKVISVPEEELSRKKIEQEEQEANRNAPMSNIQERTRRARELAARLQQQNANSGSDTVASGGSGYDNADEDYDDLEAYFSKLKTEAAPEVREKLIGFARVFSGTLKVGQELYLLQPKYDPITPERHCDKVIISDLFILMGRDLVSLKEVPAGNIVGIGGLDGKVLKNGTLVSIEHGGPNLASLTNIGAPILRVAVEPTDPTKLAQLENGLRLLNLSDPMVQVAVADNGEHILMTAGELHLERCLKDLKERFAKVDIHASKPIIPYRETIVAYKGVGQQKAVQNTQPKDNDYTNADDLECKDKQGTVEIEMDPIYVKLRVEPLPKPVVSFLNENQDKIETLVARRSRRLKEEDSGKDEKSQQAVLTNDIKQWETFAHEFDTVVSESFSKMKEKDISQHLLRSLKLENVMAFGPKRTGPNLLVDDTSAHALGHKVFSKKYSQEPKEGRFIYEESLVTGFQLATQQGPLTAEPIEGIVTIIEVAEYKDTAVKANEGNAEDDPKEESQEEEKEIHKSGLRSNISGRLISTTKERIHQGFLEWSPRLLMAMYQVEIQTTTEILGKVYGVINKRRGKILSEEMREGTHFFLIHASLPVVEAFGFSEEMRKRTSGAANAQLRFSGFHIAVDEDPFWVPSTEEELEELGEFADRENVAKIYMDQVRRRKGLAVDDKVVRNAEKQRTLKK